MRKIKVDEFETKVFFFVDQERKKRKKRKKAKKEKAKKEKEKR